MSKKMNFRTLPVFHDYFARLKSLALTAFEWEGLPETCSARFLEDTLFQYGHAVFVNDPELSFLNLKVTPAEGLNVYNEPVLYHAYSTGYSAFYKASECVYIRNNYLAKSTESTILLFAEKLTEIDLSHMVNVNAQKTPVLIECDEKTRRSLEALYEQYTGNMPVIFGHKQLTANPLSAITTGAPFVADKLREEKRAVWNEALEFLGLNTNPSDKKKERLIVNEVDANNEQIEIQADAMLATREEACAAINKMFGLNVRVKRRVKDETPVEPEKQEV